jgi:hypothetical protein
LPHRPIVERARKRQNEIYLSARTALKKTPAGNFDNDVDFHR